MKQNKELITQSIKKLEKIFNNIITSLIRANSKYAETKDNFDRPQKLLLSYLCVITVLSINIKKGVDDLINNIEKALNKI
jgi:hypothetical protein